VIGRMLPRGGRMGRLVEDLLLCCQVRPGRPWTSASRPGRIGAEAVQHGPRRVGSRHRSCLEAAEPVMVNAGLGATPAGSSQPEGNAIQSHPPRIAGKVTVASEPRSGGSLSPTRGLALRRNSVARVRAVVYRPTTPDPCPRGTGARASIAASLAASHDGELHRHNSPDTRPRSTCASRGQRPSGDRKPESQSTASLNRLFPTATWRYVERSHSRVALHEIGRPP